MVYTVKNSPVRNRALAPDLARGVMLWFIAVANAAGVAFGGTGVNSSPEGIERWLNLLLTTGVHARAYPVFAIMFGYGLVQMARRQERGGARIEEVRGLLLRRNTWLVVFGFIHAALLYYGDFLGAYGLIGMAATLALLRRGDRLMSAVLWIWGLCLLEVIALAGMSGYRIYYSSGAAAGVPVQMVGSLVATGYLPSMAARLKEWPLHTLTILPAIIIVWLGMWAARRRILDDPAGHLRLLRRVAAAGLGVAWVGGLPLGLVSAGLLRVDSSAVDALFLLHQVSGMFGGPGYAAVVGLLVGSGLKRSGVGPVAALGQRSLSGYLFQSLAWPALGLRHSMVIAVLAATIVWLVSLAGAWWFDKRAHPGYAEALLRRLTYGQAYRLRPRTYSLHGER